MQPTIEVHLTRADMDAEWARNNPGPVEPFKPQIASRPVSVIAREKGGVPEDYVLDRIEPVFNTLGHAYNVFFKPAPVVVPEQNLSLEGLF